MKERPTAQASTTPSIPSSGGVRSAAARLLGAGNGSRALSFVGGNGVSRPVSGSSRIGGSAGASTGSGSSQPVANFDDKGTYLIFNSADTLFISDLNSQDKVFHLVVQICFTWVVFYLTTESVIGSYQVHTFQQLEPSLPCL